MPYSGTGRRTRTTSNRPGRSRLWREARLFSDDEGCGEPWGIASSIKNPAGDDQGRTLRPGQGHLNPVVLSVPVFSDEDGFVSHDTILDGFHQIAMVQLRIAKSRSENPGLVRSPLVVWVEKIIEQLALIYNGSAGIL